MARRKREAPDESLRAHVRAVLTQHRVRGRCVVGYSGGRDSHVLLTLLSTLSWPVLALHIDHGWSERSSQWAQHCLAVCEALGVSCAVEQITQVCPPGESREAFASQQRTAIFQSYLKPEDVLLTGHHAQDQAETVLLQLLRGAGPQGLAAMPEVKVLGAGRQLRPLLTVAPQLLADYAKAQQLSWIEDPSNDDSSFDRNYLRHQVFPILQQRWPGLNKTLSRSAKHCASMVDLCAEQMACDLASCQEQSGVLNMATLQRLSRPCQAAVIRTACRRWGLALPQTRHLQAIMTSVMEACEDANPQVCWADVIVRRYRERLYFDRRLPDSSSSAVVEFTLADQAVVTPNGILTWQASHGEGIAQSALSHDAILSIRTRQGGETLYLNGHRQSLKKLCQHWAIPPWQRAQLPLLYYGEQLIAVVGYAIADQYRARVAQIAWQLTFVAQQATMRK